MAKQRIVHPFADQGNYTSMHNAVFDVMLPTLPPNAFKVLCFVIRQTRGWRKERAQLSYTEIARGTGIKSSATLSEAIKALLCKAYIVAKSRDSRWDATDYELNTDLEIDVSTTESEAEPTLVFEVGSTSEIKVGAALETEAIPTSKTEGIMKKGKEKKTPPPAPANGHAPVGGGGGGGGSIDQEPTANERYLLSEGFSANAAYEFRLLELEACRRDVTQSKKSGQQNGGIIKRWRRSPPCPLAPIAPPPPTYERPADALDPREAVRRMAAMLPKKEHT